MDHLVTELGMSKGLCIKLLCVRVRLCCALRHVMQFLPDLVEQCICVSFTKVMVSVLMMFWFVLLVSQNS